MLAVPLNDDYLFAAINRGHTIVYCQQRPQSRCASGVCATLAAENIIGKKKAQVVRSERLRD